jgi:F-type H+-transporting ATPase subunit gamma
MAQLTQLKHRIKAIETIKKITHAMRLISISTHARLKNKEAALTHYTNTLSTLYHTIKKEVPTWHHPYLNPAPDAESRSLIIIMGSEKGLCGSFNTMLFQFLRATLRTYQQSPDVMVVGKKTLDYTGNVDIGPIIKTYSPITMSTISQTAETIIHDLTSLPVPYTHVTVVSNKFRSFFVQQPHITRLIPFDPAAPREHTPIDTTNFIWEQEPSELLDTITHQCIQATLHTLLFQSLLSEQAARFLSMDNSTRSAEGLLEVNKLQYNKMRQAKITKELTELTGGF